MRKLIKYVAIRKIFQWMRRGQAEERGGRLLTHSVRWDIWRGLP